MLREEMMKKMKQKRRKRKKMKQKRRRKKRTEKYSPTILKPQTMVKNMRIMFLTIVLLLSPVPTLPLVNVHVNEVVSNATNGQIEIPFFSFLVHQTAKLPT